MNSAVSSSASSALSSRQSSRGTTPLPRFWRGYALCGLTTAGLLGLYKFGSAIKDYFYNKFHKPLVQVSPTPTPKPKSHVIQNNHSKLKVCLIELLQGQITYLIFQFTCK